MERAGFILSRCGFLSLLQIGKMFYPQRIVSKPLKCSAMHILVIAQLFPPDMGGGSTRAYNAVKGLVSLA